MNINVVGCNRVDGGNYGLRRRTGLDPDGAWRIHYDLYAAIKGLFLRNTGAYGSIRHTWASN